MDAPGWVPRGAIPDPHVWAYDLKRGKWVAPGEEVKDNAKLVQMPPDFDPRGRGQGVQVVLSPPGVPAPPGAIAYTPETRALHAPGEVPPIDLENLSVILAPRPGPPRPAGPATPAGPVGPPGALPGGMPPPSGGLPPVLTGMPAPPAGPPVTPSGGSPMPAAPPPQPAPAPPPAAPGVGKPPSLYAQKAHDILQSLLGTPNPVPTGMGQDVGVGEDVGVGAALSPPGGGELAYVGGISQNTLPPDMAATACGPAAALFATRMGRQPTAQEANQLREVAMRHGWRPGAGMTSGPDGVIAIARELGVTLERGAPDPARMREDATNGLPVILSTAQGRTPGHYWQVEDYDAQSGKFVLGDAVGARAPQRLMSIQEIERHPSYGGPVTALYVAGASRARDREPSARATGGQMQLLSSQSQQSAAPTGQIDTSNRESYLRTAMPYFQQVEQTTGIPAAAMAALSINEGVLSPGTIAHDHGVPFGIKSASQDANGNDADTGLPVIWRDAWEVRNGRNTTERSAFVQFPDPVSSIQGFVDFLQRNRRYQPALEAAQRGTDTREFISLLHNAGYATDPAWTTKLVNIANQIPTTPAAPAGLSLLQTNPTDISNLPDWMQAAVTSHVDRAQETEQQAGIRIPFNPQRPDTAPAGPATTSIQVPPTPPRSGSPILDNPLVRGAGIGLRNVTGAAASALGTAASQAANTIGTGYRAVTDVAQGLAGSSSAPTPTPTQAAPSNTNPNWGTSPGPTGPQRPLTQDQWGQVPYSQPGPRPGYTDPVPARPADPRLTEKDADGVPMYGTAGSTVPVPGVPHLIWKVYGPDQGDGLGRQIEDPDAIKAAREASQQEYMRRLAMDERNATNEENRRLAREKMEVAQLQFQQTQNEINARAQLAREQRQNELESRQWQFANQLVGPEGAQVARRMAPGGLIVDHQAGLAYALGEDGQIAATFQVPRPAPKGVDRPGYGRQEETIDPTTKQLTYRDTGQYGQTVVGGRVLSESPRGLVQTGRLSVDPEVARWTDPWGREHMMNTRTGESLILNEGASTTKQIGRRTYNIPPPEAPRYTPPLFTPTTYGAPEIPQAGAARPLLPGVTRNPDGTYLVPRSLVEPFLPRDVPIEQPPPPQFLDPNQESGTIGEETLPLVEPVGAGLYG